MSSANPHPEQKQEQEQDESSKKVTSENNSTQSEEWDGEERRSEDRPWGDKEDNSEEHVLSQEERDALSGDIEELSDASGVISYDFYSPAHINKSSLPALVVVNEKIINHIKPELESFLQKDIEVTADEIEIVRYGEFISSLPCLVDMNLVNISKIDAKAMLSIDGALIEIVMDSYFGGEGILSDDDEKSIFTPAELKMSDKLIEIFLDSNKFAWEKIENLDFKVVQKETQPKLLNLIEEKELVVVCKFNINLGNESSYIRFAYPYKGLDPIKNSLRSIVSEQNDENNSQWKNKFFNSLKTVPIELNAVLTNLVINVDKVANFKTGDVIPFAMPESVIVYSNHIPIFKGKVGAVNDCVAIKIDERIKIHDSKK